MEGDAGEDAVATSDRATPAFEAIQALPGFCTLTKRSPTLDGHLQLRAAQHCSPVFEGNEAGFQISLAQPMTLRRARRGIHIDMTPLAFEQTQHQVGAALDRLVAAGLLERGGYWQRLLAGDAMPVRGNRIWLWTGFLVKPAPGVALRVGPAFNRRSRVTVVEHAIVDPDRFTPLVLTIDGGDLPRELLWIHSEIGCVVPTATHAELRLVSIRQAPEIARAHESYFDTHYFETKKTKPTGKYRRLIRQDDRAPSETCVARAIYAGPHIHSVTQLRRFHHPLGVAHAPPAGVQLPECTVRNVGAYAANWNGQTFTSEEKNLDSAVRSLARDWQAAGGDTGSDAYESIKNYISGPLIDEPNWIVQTWVFADTPPGWSSVIDGFSVGGADGMRGIIRSDKFHLVGTLFRMYGPGRLSFRKNAPLLRFFPIPRRIQFAPLRLVDQLV